MATRTRVLGICIGVALAAGAVIAWKSCGGGAPAGSHTATAGTDEATGAGKARDHASKVATTIGGRVTRTSDGAGVANAIVSVAPAELLAMFIAHSSSPTMIAHTDANGGWTIANVRPGAYIVGATAAGFLPGSREKITIAPGDDRRDLDLALVAGGSNVTGIVTDVGGGGVPEARITAHHDRDRPELGGSPELVAITDHDGHYALTLADGDYDLEATHDDYTSGHHRIEVAGAPVVADFKLVPGAVIRGQVVARDTGKGVPGAMIFAEGRSDSSTAMFADDDGNFVLRGLASGTAELHALAHGYASETPTAVSVGIGEQVDGVRVLVDRAYSISGKTVQKTGGEPLAGITLGAFSIMSKQLGLALEPSAKDGAFEIVGLRPGSYIVFAVGEAAVPEVGNGIDIVDKDVTGVVIALERGVTISGRVEPPTANVEITLELAAEVGLGNMFDMAKTILVHATTDGMGAFTLTHVPVGAFVIHADAKDGSKGKLPITVAAVEQRGLIVKLEPRASIAGRVIDTSGKGVAGVRVVAHSLDPHPKISITMGNNNEDDTTSADGSFKIVGLDPGKYRVGPSQGFGGRRDKKAAPATKAEAEVELAAGAAKTGVTLTVEARDGVIEGVVIGPDHTPAADAWVTAYRTSDRPEASTSDEPARRFGGPATTPVLTGPDGKFAIGKLQHGVYDLVVEGPRGATHAEKIGVKTGERVTIELLSLGTIAGVVTLGGVPVPKYVIACTGPTGEDTSRQIDAKDGAYSIERLAPGKYKCDVESDAGTAKDEVDIPASPVKHDFALARWATITGAVVGVLDKRPIAGVHVFAGDQYSSRNLGAVLAGNAPTTDPSGRFTIERVSAGGGTVAVMPTVGFQPLGSRTYTIKEGERLDVGTIEVVPPRKGDAGTFGLTTKIEDGKLIVDGVTDGGPAATAGIAVGDHVTAIDGRDVATVTPEVAGVVLAPGTLAAGTPLVLTIDRGGAPIQVTITAVQS